MSETFTEEPVAKADAAVRVPAGELAEFREAERERDQLTAGHYRASCEELEAELAEARAELAFIREQVQQAVKAERERIRSAAAGLKVTLWRPGNGPGQEQALDVVPLADLLRLLEGP